MAAPETSIILHNYGYDTYHSLKAVTEEVEKIEKQLHGLPDTEQKQKKLELRYRRRMRRLYSKDSRRRVMKWYLKEYWKVTEKKLVAEQQNYDYLKTSRRVLGEIETRKQKQKHHLHPRIVFTRHTK